VTPHDASTGGGMRAPAWRTPQPPSRAGGVARNRALVVKLNRLFRP
jgi:hypothetical protein